MKCEIFISHLAPDKLAAEAVCAALENRYIRCCLAPRDIRPGTDWGDSVMEAIREARVVVLIFSSHANGSPQIVREVEQASRHGVPVIPLRIENVAPTTALEQLANASQWLDAYSPPLERHLKQLIDVVQEILKIGRYFPTLYRGPRGRKKTQRR